MEVIERATSIEILVMTRATLSSGRCMALNALHYAENDPSNGVIGYFVDKMIDRCISLG